MAEPCARESCPSTVGRDRLATTGLTERRRTFCCEICFQWDQRWRRIEARLKTARADTTRMHLSDELLELAMLSEGLNAWRIVVDGRPGRKKAA